MTLAGFTHAEDDVWVQEDGSAAVFKDGMVYYVREKGENAWCIEPEPSGITYSGNTLTDVVGTVVKCSVSGSKATCTGNGYTTTMTKISGQTITDTCPM